MKRFTVILAALVSTGVSVTAATGFDPDGDGRAAVDEATFASIDARSTASAAMPDASPRTTAQRRFHGSTPSAVMSGADTRNLENGEQRFQASTPSAAVNHDPGAVTDVRMSSDGKASSYTMADIRKAITASVAMFDKDGDGDIDRDDLAIMRDTTTTDKR